MKLILVLILIFTNNTFAYSFFSGAETKCSNAGGDIIYKHSSKTILLKGEELISIGKQYEVEFISPSSILYQAKSSGGVEFKHTYYAKLVLKSITNDISENFKVLSRSSFRGQEVIGDEKVFDWSMVEEDKNTDEQVIETYVICEDWDMLMAAGF